MVSEIIIREIIKKGFPAGAQLTVNTENLAPEERFWVIPGNNGPRWLIPQDIRYSGLIFKHWKPYDLISRVKWKMLYCASRVGKLGCVPGIASVGIVGYAQSKWLHLGWEGDYSPVPIAYIGTPGATQKAVISLFDSSSNKLISVAKIPLGIRASNNILREYDVLCRMEIERPGVAPRPIFVDRTHGLSVQEAIEGKHLGYKFTHKHAVYLKRLGMSGCVTTIRVEAERLAKRFAKLKNNEESLGRYIGELVYMLKDTTKLPVVQMHGDFKPWNLIQNKDGEIVAVDWEFSEPNQIVSLDVIHYFYEKGLFKNKKKYHRLYVFLQKYLQEFGVDRVGTQLTKSLLNYYSLWYVVMLCENGYDATEHIQLLGDLKV